MSFQLTIKVEYRVILYISQNTHCYFKYKLKFSSKIIFSMVNI
ncbi:hypothetical protein BDE27_1064 [Xenorhabdus ehlersii]|uniref:Uncharacterized protein n=1 Tax=Xenorhabdus ehlersii TaxID=290111 RepID=A0A2D0IKA8_9GAMM|nr:hypothetical protein Xehl_03947 [Xenorhabdus ehlersii]RKE93331.1 hypothetical protein BDE27_1064 [Xenorhabdus ehlersii]